MATATSPAGGSLGRIVLTDQAEVAVHVARALVEGTGRRPTVAHLVAGIAGEPEGLAGRVIRQAFGEVAPRIAVHPHASAGALPPIDAAAVALPVQDRPCWTPEVLAAARRVGGADLDALLEDCGVHLAAIGDDLDLRMPDPHDDEGGAPETYGRLSLIGRGVEPDADLAVARTRARGGDSGDLLRWLEVDDATAGALRGAPTVGVDAVLARALLSDLGVGRGELVTAITHLSLRAALTSG